MSNPDGRVYEDEMREGGELTRHEVMYLQNLSRADLIALIEDERRNQHPRSSSSSVRDDDKDTLIDSLRYQLEESERRNRELQAVIRKLQTDLDSRRHGSNFSPRLNPLVQRRGRTPGSSMSSGFSSLNLTPIDTRTSVATANSTDMEMEAIGKLHTLNSTIVATASSLSKRIRYNDLLLTIPDRKTIEGVQHSFIRATWLVGDRVANALYTQPLPKNAADRDPPILLTQIVFEAVFAKWAAIILGYTDEVIENAGDDATPWQQAMRELENTPSNSDKWFASIMSCIHDVMMIAGWSFKKTSTSDSKIPLSPVISAIQGTQKALEDISSLAYNVSVYVVKPGSIFNPMPDMMTDAFASGKRSIFGLKKRPSTSDRVVATTGLGLISGVERLAPRAPPLSPPRIVLERTFLDAFTSSPDLEEQPVRIRVGGGRSAAIAPVKVRVGG
ncbi:hypothetical protein EST38_g2553 [Candolleomyces aberdarensis]|uniref:Uncharacterized protein n=1 Tax=Candolleomyces aberdarensis TaxID=2316362 RepID=A0A4Q2DT91_9AGAR|nr:hypothetical protein EST38_g2553 [Candolleomyces aberdarensis]